MRYKIAWNILSRFKSKGYKSSGVLDMNPCKAITLRGEKTKRRIILNSSPIIRLPLSFPPLGEKFLPWRKTFSAFACEQASRLREAETVLHKEFIANVTLHLREEVGRLGGRF
jgi:hypothetical protein